MIGKRYTLRDILVAILVTCFLAYMAMVVYGTYQYLFVDVDDSYLVWHCAELLIDYMDHHDGNWPTGWDDLSESHQRVSARSARSGGRSLDEIANVVEIDWSFDPKSQVSGQDAARVIWLTNGGHAHWEGYEPNEMIRQYILSRAQKPSDDRD